MGMTYWRKLPRVVGMLAGAMPACKLLPRPAQPKTHRRPAPRARRVPLAPSQKKSKKSKKVRGQKAIDATRTKQIQQALIEQKYMQGEPSGKWDDTTQAALRKYQADHGWQSKTVPDSRALIKLGLGPSKEGLLNPETAMTSASEHPATSAKPTEAEASGKARRARQSHFSLFINFLRVWEGKGEFRLPLLRLDCLPRARLRFRVRRSRQQRRVQQKDWGRGALGRGRRTPVRGPHCVPEANAQCAGYVFPTRRLGLRL